MKKLLIVAAVVAVVFNSCGTGGGRIKSDLDSLAYSLGIDAGLQFKSIDSMMNPNIIAKGIIDAFNNKSVMSRDSAQNIQREYIFVKLPAKKLKEEVAYLESVESANKNVVKTESGLMYEIIMPGDMSVKAENDADGVKVNYIGRFKEALSYDAKKEGQIFDQGNEVEFPLNGVIKGWTEGLKYIGKGGKIRLWIPSNLAYGQGNQAYGGPIGPNETLVFDVDLLEVNPVEVVPANTEEIN